MSFIDLRSDTVTRPSAAMRRAMAEAEVGDDVYGEDPTINRLEQLAAEITGKEAAMFVASGTMGNTIAIKLHTEHGQEVVCESRSHIFNFELAMMAWFTGCLARTVEAPGGILTWKQIKPAIRPLSPHRAPTGLIEIENTSNLAGGRVYPLDVIAEICEGAHALGLPVHMDGARVFNAATALGVSVREIVAPVDTVMFCLSKGLGAPVGSMLAGSAEQITRARLYRKRLGGAMRQAGVLAAAGLVALEQHTTRLGVDHANARFVAESLAKLPGFGINPAEVETNILIVDVAATGIPAPEFSQRLRERGVLMNAVNDRAVRIVTHLDVTREQCELALFAMAEVTAATELARGASR